MTAYIGPLLGLLGGLVSVVAYFLQRRLSHRLDIDLKTREANLRAHVDITVHRARVDIERDLKNHEVRLRVAADFRLKMLDRMMTDVADFRAKQGMAIAATIQLMNEVAPRGGRSERAAELFVAAQERFAALSSAGPFMPAELFGPTTDLANEFNACLREVAEWSSLQSQEERYARCEQTSAKMTEIASRARQLFGTWQAQQFHQFTSHLDEIGTDSSAAGKRLAE